MKCICKNMIEADRDTYKSVDYKGFTLHENYGTWDLRFSDDVYQSIEIFYCPFCGRKLNKWDWAKERRKANFEEYIKMKF